MKSLKERILEGILDIEDNINYDISKDVIEEFLKDNYQIWGSYTIKKVNNEFIVDVKGKVRVKNTNIGTLTNGFFEFGVVSDGFYCSDCHLLKTLEGAPKEVGMYFYCNYCDSLTSLNGAPKKVGSNFDCSLCRLLKTLKGAPEEVGGSFYCHQCRSLKTLEGAPKKVGNNFDCNYCDSLTSLKGAPKKVGNNFNCNYCDSLTSLESAPKEVGGSFNCKGCGVQFTEEDIRKYTKVTTKKIYV